MPDLAATVTSVRRAIELLTTEDSGATEVALALARWLRDGEDLASALGLPTDWHQRLRVAARDRALAELSRVHADLDCKPLADRIVAELARARPGRRRDGSLGLIDDLTTAGCTLGARQLRRLIADIRHGQQDPCNGHDEVAALAPVPEE